VAAFEHPASRAHASELVTDRPGRSQTPTRGTYGSGLERASLHAEELLRFAREIAAYLEPLARTGTFDRLVVVAPPKLLGVLRGELGPLTRTRIAMQLARDYVRLSPTELDEHVRHASGDAASAR
jgi:protein required for attachment to host cells